jgi:toxin-antitoxin system PIN domain toxin
VIVVDANLLIYAHNSDSADFDRSREWLEHVLSEETPVGLPWAVIHAFLRLTTGKVVLPRPLDVETATTIIDEWLSLPSITILEAGPGYWPIFRELLRKAKISGKMVTDAHIAALAIEHDAALYTADRDFRRFPGLRVINPLA